jgi:hemoglobin-like flavoprotein
VTPSQVMLVQASFEKVKSVAATVADLFYDRLFEIAPETRGLFPPDLTEQKERLITSLDTTVTSLHRLEAVLAVKALGERHKGYGVVAEHYAPVGEALIWALEKGVGDDFNAEVKAAWIGVYTTLTRLMTS